MGDIAEMMLDGTLCEGCGQYLGGTEFNTPLLCAHCAKERLIAGRDIALLGAFWQDCGEVAPQPPASKVRCPTCSKLVKSTGLSDHARVMHLQPQSK